MRGDLEDATRCGRAPAGADVAFHAAAHLGEWGDREEFERINVGGTRNALEAAAPRACAGSCTSGRRRGCSPGEPLVNVNEDAPLRPDSKALYSATKAMAEQVVRDANGDGFETVVVRPRLVWGAGDTTILPSLVGRSRRSASPGSAADATAPRPPTSTT